MENTQIDEGKVDSEYVGALAMIKLPRVSIP